jgi:hypothetical protein
MNDVWNYRDQLPSVHGDLGPLPLVVESNTETTWKLFVNLQGQQDERLTSVSEATLDEVMKVARIHNRICPKEPSWSQLCRNLQELTGKEPPQSVTGPASTRTPPLVKRLRLRDQAEWAERNGQLEHVLAFFQSLDEDQWTHMRA